MTFRFPVPAGRRQRSGWITDIRRPASGKRRSADVETLGAEGRGCARSRHSPHFRMAVNTGVRSTSAFGWKDDPQICAIPLRNRRPEIGGGDSGNARSSPNGDTREGCCQTNANRSQLADDDEVSGHAQPTPLGKSGGAVSLKVVAAVEVAFLVEVVMDGGVDGSELLQTSHASETQHRSFSSS